MKKYLALVLTLAMVFALCACGRQAAPAATAAPAGVAAAEPAPSEPYITITISADRAGDEAQMVMIDHIVENVPLETEGRVKIELITPGTMGSLGEMTDEILLGTLGMAAIPDNTSGPYLNTNTGFLNLPGLFAGYDDVAAAFASDGWLGAYLDEVFEANGAKRLGLVDNGFRTLGSTDKQLCELEDFKNVKIRVPEVEENIFQFQEMGALPVAISSSELLNALENKTVDAADQSITNYVSNGIENTVKYINLIYDRYSSSSLLMNLDMWNSLTAEDQEIVGRVCAEGAAKQFEASKDIALGYIEKFSADGTWVVTERSESVNEALADITAKMINEFGSKWDPTVVDLIREQVG